MKKQLIKIYLFALPFALPFALTFALPFASALTLSAQVAGDTTKPPFSVYSKVNIRAIHPQGWINEFLVRQSTGLTGHIEVAGYPFNTGLWACEKMKGSQEAWWPYEQTAYYLDGVNRLGLLLNDDTLKAKADRNTDYVKAHLAASGRYGTVLTDRWARWPYATFNRLFMTDYETQPDTAIITMMVKHYLSFTAKDFADDLELANVEEICWLYGHTQDQRLINMAMQAYDLFKSDLNYRNRAGADMVFSSDKAPNHHGVVYLELVKIPLILYSYTGRKDYLAEAMNGIRTMEKYDMLVSGLPSSTEHFGGISELAGTEVCNTATLPYTYGYFLRTTGDATFGDRIEKAVFNGGIGSVSKDFKTHQYFSSPNQFIATSTSGGYGFDPSRGAFKPGHDVECCTGNVNRFMPYYVEQMWLDGPGGGIVAALFGPSQLQAEFGGKQITITEQTNYPFEEAINFNFSTSGDVRFPFLIRIPAWSASTEILVNGKRVDSVITPGTFFVLNRTFHNNDVITLRMPMTIRSTEWPHQGIAIERGPLVYSLPIKADKTLLPVTDKSTAEFRGMELRPAATWNYALDERTIAPRVEFVKVRGYPWDEHNSPVRILVPARKISDWKLKTSYDTQWKVSITGTPAFPAKYTTGIQEMIELVPYGSTMLRVTVFPDAAHAIRQPMAADATGQPMPPTPPTP